MIARAKATASTRISRSSRSIASTFPAPVVPLAKTKFTSPRMTPMIRLARSRILNPPLETCPLRFTGTACTSAMMGVAPIAASRYTSTASPVGSPVPVNDSYWSQLVCMFPRWMQQTSSAYYGGAAFDATTSNNDSLVIQYVRVWQSH